MELKSSFSRSHLSLCTQFLSHQCTFEWHINNFSKHSLKTAMLYSPEFSPVKDCCTKWRVAVTFIEGGMEVSFKRCDNSHMPFEGVYSLSVENTSGNVLDLLTAENISCFLDFRMGRPLTSRDIISLEGGLFKLEKDDTLVIKGLIQLTDCCVDTKIVQE